MWEAEKKELKISFEKSERCILTQTCRGCNTCGLNFKPKAEADVWYLQHNKGEDKMGEVIKGVPFGVEKSATDPKTQNRDIDAVLAKTRKELK